MAVTVNKKIRIKINGVEYASPDQVPPEFRAVFEKAMQSGRSVSLTHKPATVGELPPDVRQRVSDALGSAATPQRIPTWLWAVLVAGLASFLLYLYQNAH